MLRAGLSRWSVRRSFATGAAGAAAAVALGACGSALPSGSASGSFPVSVSARFPSRQHLAQYTHLVITVRNAGSRTIPNVAVTILNPFTGTAAQAFAHDITPNQGQVLAGRSRPIWIVDRPPGPCQYSCQQGGPGAGATAFSNTWALGRLAPGKTATFEWGLTAVAAGRWEVAYEVAAALNDRAHAIETTGRPPEGTFFVNVSSAPRQAYVNNNGQVVNAG
jgi:hypothetical protein